MAFLFRENRRHGTDGQTEGQMQRLCGSHRVGRIITVIVICVLIV